MTVPIKEKDKDLKEELIRSLEACLPYYSNDQAKTEILTNVITAFSETDKPILGNQELIVFLKEYLFKQLPELKTNASIPLMELSVKLSPTPDYHPKNRRSLS